EDPRPSRCDARRRRGAHRRPRPLLPPPPGAQHGRHPQARRRGQVDGRPRLPRARRPRPRRRRPHRPARWPLPDGGVVLRGHRVMDNQPVKEKNRNPLLAALLSVLLPGLGQLYSGRWRRAVTLIALALILSIGGRALVAVQAGSAASVYSY